eukprot:1217731-Amphidinium_carterae.1
MHLYKGHIGSILGHRRSLWAPPDVNQPLHAPGRENLELPSSKYLEERALQALVAPLCAPFCWAQALVHKVWSLEVAQARLLHFACALLYPHSL